MNLRPLIYIILSLSLSSCNGCSKSAQKFRNKQENQPTLKRERESRITGKTIVKMEKRNGVYYVPVELNGAEMDFIFDTGAGIISISETEATFLMKQGTLTKDDIKGTAKFSDANGDISEGTIINLKTVKIGDIILKDIEASVVHNSIAPLLLGQSAFEKFGKISIDYKKGEITLE
jgi:aspartyl protease family protein